jgi:hypothetical protein
MTFVSVSSLVKTYISKRDDFHMHRGESYQKDKQDLRFDYCRAKISCIELGEWINNISDEEAKKEFSKHFEEWELKISRGVLKKIIPEELSCNDFISRVDAFYKKYAKLLSGTFFREFSDAEANLRTVLLPELKKSKTESIAKKYLITDEELTYRMKFQWKALKT